MSLSSRRGFLMAGSAAAAAAQAATETADTLPTTEFRGKRITRLVIGSNPLYGYSHFNKMYDQIMREWMTPERRAETLHRAEAAGINIWQATSRADAQGDWKRHREEGGRLNVIVLADYSMEIKSIPEIAKAGPLGIAYHGGRTDERFRNGQMEVVRDFTRAIRDAGVAVGISTHNPAVIDYVESKGWDIDYYMTCLYRVTRTPEESRRELGEAPLGEVFLERDPERMTAMVRKTKKFCFAFKLLAAGRSIASPEQVENAFRFAFANIKPTDAVIVGMFPKFRDEPRENAEIVRNLLRTT